MKLRPLLLAVLVAIAVFFTVPAAAQPAPNSACFLVPEEEAYFCLGPVTGVLVCPDGEPAEEGETLSCSRFLEFPSTPTGELFNCLVLEVFEGGSILDAFCTPVDGGGGDGGGDGAGGSGGQQGGGDSGSGGSGGGAGGATPITQEGEQESEAGEVDQSFEVS